MKTPILFFSACSLRVSASLFVIVLLLAACDKPIVKPTLCELTQNPFITLGTYESIDAHQGEALVRYNMLIRTEGERNDAFIIANFANLKTDVHAYAEGDGIGLTEEGLGLINGIEHVLLSGHAATTAAGKLQIHFRVREGTETVSYVINGTYTAE